MTRIYLPFTFYWLEKEDTNQAEYIGWFKENNIEANLDYKYFPGELQTSAQHTDNVGNHGSTVVNYILKLPYYDFVDPELALAFKLRFGL